MRGTSTQHSSSAAYFDGKWLEDAGDKVQALALALELDRLEPVECVARALSLCESIPRPGREVERMCLVVLLLGVAVRLSAHLHASVELNRVCACEVTIAHTAAAFVTHPLEPQETFVAWLKQFASAYSREHTATPATRVASLIRTAPARHWTVDELAAHAGVRPRWLRRQFGATFGLCIRRYLEASRVAAVFSELCDRGRKVSAVADNAGYKSPKDFYRAVRNSLHHTPGSLRSLSDADRATLRRSLEASLAGRPVIPGQHEKSQQGGNRNSERPGPQTAGAHVAHGLSERPEEAPAGLDVVLRRTPLKATLRARAALSGTGGRSRVG